VVSGKLIADTMEALIGAVEMDGGGEAALEEVMRTLGVL
jgi:dsRNA-specific ribonuclease